MIRLLDVRRFLLPIVSVVLLLAAASAASAQLKPYPTPPGSGPMAVPATGGTATAEKPDKPEDAGNVLDTRERTAEPVGPREIRLQLRDGNIIAGDLSIDEITVETDFGTLKVPIDKIRRFHPGLDSYPQVSARLEKLIADLGNEDYATREAAHKELVHWGLPIRGLLSKATPGDNAERKRHLTEILSEFEELAGDEDEFSDEEQDRELIHRDTVVTTEFTIVGRIVQQEFKVASKYGDLVVKLADVDTGDRAYNQAEPIQKKLGVDGAYVAQRQFKSSGIRVKAGDRVTVRADGQVVMSPWGSNALSTPDGGANYGWYIPNEIPGGALVAKIGNGGKAIKIGGRSSFVARSSGVLQFAIGIDNGYAGEGYSYPGRYEVRVKVEPK